MNDTKSSQFLDGAILSVQCLLKLNSVDYNISSLERADSLKSTLKNISQKTKGQLNFKRLSEQQLEAIHLPLVYQNKSGEFSALAKISREQALIKAPYENAPKVITRASLKQEWTGQVIQYHKSGSKFDISWFIPEFVRHRKFFSEILEPVDLWL